MSLQKAFLDFNKKIALSRKDDAYKTAREKDKSLLADIIAALEKEGYAVKRTLLQGSHGKPQLAVHPLNGDDFDIDRAIVIEEKGSLENPVTVKKVIKKVFVDRKFKNPTIKKPCVTADYAQKPIHLDYPIYREDFWGDLYLAVGRENSGESGRKWELNDPEGLMDWICSHEDYQSFFGADLTDLEFAQFRRILRDLKRWRDYKIPGSDRKYIYSIGLTIMVRRCFCPSVDSEGRGNDLDSMTRTISAVLGHGYFTETDTDKYDLQVILPVEPKRDVFENHGTTVGTKLHAKLSDLLSRLEEVEREESLKKQCEILNKQFGDDFPIYEEKQTASKYAAPYVGLQGHSSGA